MRALSALGLLSLELARFTQSTHISSFCSFPYQSLRWKGNFPWLGSFYCQLWHYVVGNQCSPSGVLSAAGTLSQTAMFLKSLGLAVPSPAPLGPDTCLGLDTPRLGVTERPGGAILASVPGPVFSLILPGALASGAACPLPGEEGQHSWLQGNSAKAGRGSEHKGAQPCLTPETLAWGVSPTLHAPCQALGSMLGCRLPWD